MTDYNDGKWHWWGGGECPVAPKSTVDVHYVNQFGGYKRDDSRPAGNHNWQRPCLFRVVRSAPPREWWAVQKGDVHIGLWNSEQTAMEAAAEYFGAEIIRVHEVLPK